MSNEHKLKLSGSDLAVMSELLRQCPQDMLLVPSFRAYLAKKRWEEKGRPVDIFDHANLGVMPATIEHNRKELRDDGFGSSRRPGRLLHPLSALEPIYSSPDETKLLSIGPRTEMELLHLLGLGLSLKNVRAVDLISSSPWIELGDMHALPYPDQSFDVVMSSWVLNYSNQPKRAVEEMCRVCADGGLVAIGVTYDPSFGQDYVADTPGAQEIVGSMQRSSRDLAELIGDKLSQVCFQEQPANDRTKGAVILIARIKHSARQES